MEQPPAVMIHRILALLQAALASPQVGLALVALLLVSLLTGCAFFDGPQPERDQLSAQITLVDDSELPPGVAGDSVCSRSFCNIRIRRSSYPLCITHEIRHGFEPLFHQGKASDESCWVSK